MSKHLLMFDVDGTLVQSLDLEDKLFPLSCEQALGIDSVSSDWSQYEVPSDRGIVSQLAETRLNRPATQEDFDKAEASFHRLIREELERFPDACRALPGAVEMIETVKALPDTIVAIATAGWRSTAHLKLSQAGFDVEGIILCSSSERRTKAEIMELATQRARSRFGIENFKSQTYVGDSPGDKQASERLGFQFIGIRSKENTNQQEEYPFSCYTDLDHFLATLKTKRK
ncbi:HAD family hydrolase [Pelagicoccus mobilis]|uniref:phosphoglycolate phosphatase n=1 Tax=Pelagicoccus mobilis TaxID=415221 RepID=A0A934VUD0_9BACT|nr:HAD hydrolase-like protein [Pelagicoccus mobilis]MBK1880414.1 HAD hydrolase-like protein [Pelagicoccus mobilis]